MNSIFASWRPVRRETGCSRPRRALLLAGLLSLGGWGCATGDYVMVATVAGGEKIRVALARGATAPTTDDGVQIQVANFTVNKDKKIVYVFAFNDSRGRALRSVRVDDVSDEAAVMLVDDAQPKLEPAGTWHRETEPLEFDDAKVGWFTTISNSLRVFRFTLTFSDGRKLVLHQGMLYPAVLKESVRRTFGLNY